MTVKSGQLAHIDSEPQSISSDIMCVWECIDHAASCLACDWNNEQQACYWGTTSDPQTVTNSSFDHYDFVFPTSCNKTGECRHFL